MFHYYQNSCVKAQDTLIAVIWPAAHPTFRTCVSKIVASFLSFLKNKLENFYSEHNNVSCCLDISVKSKLITS